MFKIGNIEIKNKVVMAPMAGISNYAFMKIAEEMNIGLAYTELISAEAIVRNNKKTYDMLNGIEHLNIPVGIQLFGASASTLAKAAMIITKLYPYTFIDINMGCPVPKVAVSAQAGSALLKSPRKVYDIVKNVVDSVNVPVTVKIRSGWDSNHVNAVEIAQVIEKAGASAITVHGRTRAQGYSGTVDLDIIKLVKENVNIPVIGNGDIKSYKDALHMLNYTKCDAIMIGRGILGNPWLIKECVDYLENGLLPKKISIEEKFSMMKRHLDLLLKTKPERVALLEIRTHIAYYLKGIPGTKELKMQIFKTNSKEEIINLLNYFLESNY